MVCGGDAITPALAALNEVVPDLDLDETGAPATPPSSDAKTLLEHALCRVLHRHVDAAGTARVPFMTWSASGSALPDLPRLLDLALLVSERGACDQGAVFTVLEQLLEACTIADAEAVFTWVESARERLSEDAVWRRGRLVMLRACNDLQRRLSKTHDVVLRGRVSLLLSSLYSLSEKSALNLTGQYNRSNPTETEAETAATADPAPTSAVATEEDGAVDAGFHKTFWSLQRFSRTPGGARRRRTAGPHSDAPSPPSSTPSRRTRSTVQPRRRRRRRRGAFGGGLDGVLGVEYLTAAPLLSLQLRDAAFRRHFLAQCAVFALLRLSRHVRERREGRGRRGTWRGDETRPRADGGDASLGARRSPPPSSEPCDARTDGRDGKPRTGARISNARRSPRLRRLRRRRRRVGARDPARRNPACRPRNACDWGIPSSTDCGI